MIAISNASGKENELTFDIRRTVILDAYMRLWKMPEYWITFMKPKAVHVEIYYFPAAEEKGVARFATIGLSANHQLYGQAKGTEWMLALPADLGGESLERIFTYLCALITHHLQADPDSGIPRLMNEDRLTPEFRSIHSVLQVNQREESVELEEIQIGDEVVRILWWYQSLGMRPH